MQKHKPLVSVIIPSYNHEKFILQTIKSIENQTYENIEILIIDDCSTDATIDLLKKPQHTKTKLIFHKENKGLIKTISEGVDLSSGEYIAFCASDDYWHPEKISLQIAEIEKDSNIKIIFTEGFDVDENSNAIGKIKYTKKRSNIRNFDEVIMHADLPPASILFRKKDLQDSGGINQSFKIEDLPIWLSLLKPGGYAKIIKKNLVFYRAHSNNMHNTFSEMVIDEHFKIIEYFSKDLSSRSKIIKEWALRNANITAGKNIKKSLSYLRKSGIQLFDYRLYACIYKNTLAISKKINPKKT